MVFTDRKWKGKSISRRRALRRQESLNRLMEPKRDNPKVTQEYLNSRGDTYYDLVEITDRKTGEVFHLPVPKISNEFLIGLPISDKERDWKLFTCPTCGEKGFYSGFCDSCSWAYRDIENAIIHNTGKPEDIDYYYDIADLTDDYEIREYAIKIEKELHPDFDNLPSERREELITKRIKRIKDIKPGIDYLFGKKDKDMFKKELLDWINAGHTLSERYKVEYVPAGRDFEEEE